MMVKDKYVRRVRVGALSHVVCVLLCQIPRHMFNVHGSLCTTLLEAPLPSSASLRLKNVPRGKSL